MNLSARSIAIPACCASLLVGGVALGSFRPAARTMLAPPGACALPDDDFFETADGGCKDLETWMVFSGFDSTQGNWDSENGYCNDLVEGDAVAYDDWTLPSKAEQLDVYDHGSADYFDFSGHAGPGGIFNYWSSTKQGTKAWAVSYQNGSAILATRNSSTLIVNCRRYSGPSNLSGVGVSTSQINLSWADNSESETGFVLERSQDQSNWTPIALAADEISYVDAGLTKNTTYYYRIVATGSVTDSPYSPVISVKTARK